MIELPKKAVILARGLGTRMRRDAAGVRLTPEQEQLAGAGIKALIPIAGGKTLLELIIANLTTAGFSEICLVIGPEHKAVRNFCEAKLLKVSFAIQDEPKGTADAVVAVESWVGLDELFLVVNSDNLYPVESLRRLRTTNSPAMLAFDREILIERSNIPADRIAKFATIEIDENGMLCRIVEKPERVDPNSFVSMNAWLFPSSIFAACRTVGPSVRGEYEITTAVQYAIDQLGGEFTTVKSSEGVLDLSSRGDIKSVGLSLKSN